MPIETRIRMSKTETKSWRAHITPEAYTEPRAGRQVDRGEAGEFEPGHRRSDQGQRQDGAPGRGKLEAMTVGADTAKRVPTVPMRSAPAPLTNSSRIRRHT